MTEEITMEADDIVFIAKLFQWQTRGWVWHCIKI